jgi:hypothetical protein
MPVEIVWVTGPPSPTPTRIDFQFTGNLVIDEVNFPTVSRINADVMNVSTIDLILVSLIFTVIPHAHSDPVVDFFWIDFPVSIIVMADYNDEGVRRIHPDAPSVPSPKIDFGAARRPASADVVGPYV